MGGQTDARSICEDVIGAENETYYSSAGWGASEVYTRFSAVNRLH